MTIAIDRRAKLSRSEFDAEYAAKSRPVILTDAIEHWPARRAWNLDYFERRFADKEVRVDNKTWRVGDFMAKLKLADGNGITPYLKEVKLDEQWPELWDDVGDMPLASRNRLASRWLPSDMRIARGVVAVFIGSRGSGFRKLHWDYSYLHVFISQVYGPKDAILFHPKDTPHLYANPEYSNLSLITDPYNVDPAMFPDVARADPTHITIGAGETLFLPAGWWHATRITEPSIAIAESTLDAFNWKLRGDWYLDRYATEGMPWIKRAALRAYLGLAGAVI